MDQTGEETTVQDGPARPRKLTLARETLRSLGDATLARAAGGMEGDDGTTTKICEFFVSYFTEKFTDALFAPPPETEYGACTQIGCQASVNYTEGCHLPSECSRYTPGCYSSGLE